MKIFITNIKSDRVNILRFVTTGLKNQIIINNLKSDQKLLNQYQILVNQYIKQLKKLLDIIKSDRDYRINSITIEINSILEYISGASNTIKITTSQIIKTDISKALIQFLETKYSDLLKIDII